MEIWSENRTGRVAFSRTEPYFDEAEAEFVVEVQTQGYAGWAFVWFRKSDLEHFQSDLDRFDLTRQGESSVQGYDVNGRTVCTLTIKAGDRRGHLWLTIDLTHRECGSDPETCFDHQVRTGFELDAGCLQGVKAECGKLLDGVLPKPSAEPAEPQPLDPTWPGLTWRFLARDWRRPMRQVHNLKGDGWTWFDELVVGDWLHIEHMNGRHWWMRVGDACINVTVPKGKPPIVNIERDIYEQRLSAVEEAKALAEGDINRDPFGDSDDDE